MYKATKWTAALLIGLSTTASSDWFFRGTPNGWSTTEMVSQGGNDYQTCQRFNGEEGSARFKIDRHGDWSEAYPSQDYAVTDFRSYEITFNSDSKQISLQEVESCEDTPPPPPPSDWFFRGTPNGWSLEDGLTRIDETSKYEITVTFNGEDHNARFKIDSGNWTESYPANDRIVDDFNTYHIVFDEDTKQIEVDKVVGEVELENLSLSPTSSINLTAGGTHQIQVIANYNDGSTDEVTSQARFQSSNTSVATVSSSGWVTARQDGQAEITVTYEGESAQARVRVGQSPVTNDFREETIYFVMTARFFDGDSSNNYFNRDRYNADDPTWRGDFKGLIEKLDYIQDLGFTAIWITPPVENRSGLDYHGYHAYDWFKVDPRLESEGGTYQDFINAAHDRGMKVIQDVVINHSSQYGIRDEVWIDHLPIKYYRDQGCTPTDLGPYQGNLGDYKSEFRDDNDNPAAPQWFRDRHNSDPDGTQPLVDPKTGTTVPSCGYDANRFFGIDAGWIRSGLVSPGWLYVRRRLGESRFAPT